VAKKFVMRQIAIFTIPNINKNFIIIPLSIKPNNYYLFNTNIKTGDFTMRYGTNSLGEGTRLFEPVTLGFPSRDRMEQTEFTGTTIGKNGVLRSGTILYCDVTIGDNFSTGHNVLIREQTTIGDNVAIGSSSVIEGTCNLGNNIRIQSMVFIPTHTSIGNGVFIGPNSILTNDRYPPTGKPELKGPVIEDDVTIGAAGASDGF